MSAFAHVLSDARVGIIFQQDNAMSCHLCSYSKDHLRVTTLL